MLNYRKQTIELTSDESLLLQSAIRKRIVDLQIEFGGITHESLLVHIADLRKLCDKVLEADEKDRSMIEWHKWEPSNKPEAGRQILIERKGGPIYEVIDVSTFAREQASDIVSWAYLT